MVKVNRVGEWHEPGIDHNIREGYKFICDKRVEEAVNIPDIVLIGFSRGGFTVQCLAKFINDVGVIPPERSDESVVKRLYEEWHSQKEKAEMHF